MEVSDAELEALMRDIASRGYAPVGTILIEPKESLEVTEYLLGECRRAGYRDGSVLGLHTAGSCGERRCVASVDAQKPQAHDGAHDVHDRIDGSNLMEMDVFNRRPVDSRLDLRQPSEDVATAGSIRRR